MPDLAGPFDAGTFAQAQWFRDAGQATPSGVLGAPSGTPGGGELGLTASGFALTLALGRARVRGAAYERTGTAWTDTVPANTNPTQARIDRVVLRRDLVTKTITPVRLQGTPAATPVAPALTQNEDGAWDEPLHRVTVPAASGTPLVITDERRWVQPQPFGASVVFGAGVAIPNGSLWGPGYHTAVSYPRGQNPALTVGSAADGFTVPWPGMYVVNWTLTTQYGPTSGRVRILGEGTAYAATPVEPGGGLHSVTGFVPIGAAGGLIKFDVYLAGQANPSAQSSVARLTRVGDIF